MADRCKWLGSVCAAEDEWQGLELTKNCRVEEVLYALDLKGWDTEGKTLSNKDGVIVSEEQQLLLLEYGMHDWSTCPKLTLHIFAVVTYLPSCSC